MLKKIQVIILPAKEEAQSYITLLHGKLYLNDKLHGYDTIQKTHHLYFLSDEEIKEGDWYLVKINYGSGGKYVDKSLARLNKGEEKEAIRLGAKKVIAITDNLELSNSTFPAPSWFLPKPSQSFLEVFVKEYNKGNVIEEVMVEYEEQLIRFVDESNNSFHGKDIIEKLKINPKDNTITIKKVKDSWNREEVIQKLQSFADDCENDNNLICYNGKINGKKNWEQTDLAKWIEQNL